MKKSLILAATALLGLMGSSAVAETTIRVPNAPVTSLENNGLYYIYDTHADNGTNDEQPGNEYCRYAFRKDNGAKAAGIHKKPYTVMNEATYPLDNSYVWIATTTDNGATWSFTNKSTGKFFKTASYGANSGGQVEMTDVAADKAVYDLEPVTDKAGKFTVKVNGTTTCRWDGNADASMHYWGGSGHQYSFYKAVADGDGYKIESTEHQGYTVSVTFNFNGVETSYSATGISGTSYTFVGPDFTVAEDTGSDRVTGVFDGDKNITVNMVRHVPFVVSENTDNLVWQAVQQHYSYRNNNVYTWTYRSDDNVNMTERYGNAPKKEGFTDEQLWAFVGNYDEGFKIYNKAAGTSKCLYFDGTNAKVGESTEKNVWKVFPHKNTKNVSTVGYCCFKTDGSNYLNLNVTDNDGIKIATWSDNDEGSTCWFVNVGEPVAAYYESNASANALGAVGMVDYAAIVDSYDAVVANPTDYTKARALTDAISNVKTIPFDANKWYRLRNAQKKNEIFGYLCATNDKTKMELWGGETEEKAMANPFTIVKFEEAGNGVYNIKNQDLYFGKLGVYESQLLQVETAETAGKYALEHKQNGQHVIRDTEQTNKHTAQDYTDRVVDCLHFGDGNKIVPQLEDWVPSKWYLVPANEIVVDLNHQNGSNYTAVCYFPFPVKATEGCTLHKLYQGTKKDNEATCVYYDKDAPEATIPANTGFFVISSEGNKATLAIDYDGAVAASDLVNTLTAGTLRSGNAQVGDYVLNGTQFNKVTDANAAVANNTAWIPAAAISKSVDALPVVEAADITGIHEINAGIANGTKVIYDLQGRRVQRAAKGLYIINGVKTLVK